MARAQSLILLACAVLLGLLAVLLATRLIAPAAAPAAPRRAVPLVKVAVAAAPIPPGAPIGTALVRLVDWPSNALPPGTFASLAELVDTAEPRVALRSIEANEPILASRVSGKGGRFSVSGLIDPALRAATIRVNDVAGVGGFVLPGDRVDVLVTRPASGEDGGSVSDVLLQNVPVLGLDQDVNEKREGPAVVKAATLEVTQQAAQKLALAQQVGTLSLVLRSTRSGGAPAPVRTIGLQDLRDETAASARPAAVRTRRGPSARPVGTEVTVVRGLRPHSYVVGRSGEIARGGQ